MVPYLDGPVGRAGEEHPGVEGVPFHGIDGHVVAYMGCGQVGVRGVGRG